MFSIEVSDVPSLCLFITLFKTLYCTQMKCSFRPTNGISNVWSFYLSIVQFLYVLQTLVYSIFVERQRRFYDKGIIRRTRQVAGFW